MDMSLKRDMNWTIQNISYIICHMSYVMCRVIYHMSYIYIFIYNISPQGLQDDPFRRRRTWPAAACAKRGGLKSSLPVGAIAVKQHFHCLGCDSCNMSYVILLWWGKESLWCCHHASSCICNVSASDSCSQLIAGRFNPAEYYICPVALGHALFGI